MVITSNCLLLDEQVPNIVDSSVSSTLSLQSRLTYTLEQQLENLQSLDLNQFVEAEYYAGENLDANILEDLGFNCFDSLPEYVSEYATVDCQELNCTRSIIRIQKAIEELKNLLARFAESTLAFNNLIKLSQSELEILNQRFITAIELLEKDYSLTGVLYPTRERLK